MAIWKGIDIVVKTKVIVHIKCEYVAKPTDKQLSTSPTLIKYLGRKPNPRLSITTVNAATSAMECYGRGGQHSSEPCTSIVCIVNLTNGTAQHYDKMKGVENKVGVIILPVLSKN